MDAKDDYCAQLKKGADPTLIGSWEDTSDGVEIEGLNFLNGNQDINYDDLPLDLQNIRNNHKK